MLKEYTVQGKKYNLWLFDEITDQEEAYLIGYMLGDGGYEAGNKKRRPRMNVSSSDKYIIDHFKDTFAPAVSVRSRIPVNKTRNIVTNRTNYIMTFNAKFYETFMKFGILNKKIDRVYKNVPDNMMPSFLSGFIDADGYITYGHRGDRNRLWCNMGILHQNRENLDKVVAFLAENIDVVASVNKKGNENVYVMRVNGVDNCYKFAKYLVNNHTGFRNTDKLAKFKSYIEMYDNEK